MDDRHDDDDRAELIRRLFAVLTQEMEDAAALAVDGQARLHQSEALQLARRLLSGTERSMAITRTILALLRADEA